jgi:hypothetical protein
MARRPSPYRVESSAATQASLREIIREAFQQGIGDEVCRVARRIIARLAADPLIYGEPIHRLRHLKLEIRVAIESPLAVRYGVDPKRRVVYIKSFHFSGSSGMPES